MHDKISCMFGAICCSERRVAAVFLQNILSLPRVGNSLFSHATMEGNINTSVSRLVGQPLIHGPDLIHPLGFPLAPP